MASLGIISELTNKQALRLKVFYYISNFQFPSYATFEEKKKRFVNQCTRLY